VIHDESDCADAEREAVGIKLKEMNDVTMESSESLFISQGIYIYIYIDIIIYNKMYKYIYACMHACMPI